MGYLLVAAGLLSMAPPTQLEIHVVDERGRPLPARLLVRPAGAECVVAADAVELQIGPDRWFMSPGKSTVTVPAGKVLLRVEHGHEYGRVKRELSLNGSDAVERVVLKRWIKMRDRGYRCGENHLHVDSVSLAPMLVCEGLDFGSSLTWFNGPDQRRPVPEGEGPLRWLQFGGHRVPTSIHDAELEYAWGAAYIQHLPEPLPMETDRSRPNLDYLKHAVEAGAIVHYQAGWSREVTVDALLGLVHTVNVCNNNFHMHRYQQRSHYSNLLEVDAFPVYPDTEVGMMRMNTDTYYRLLNCGLRLAAGAGSATGVKQVPVGYNRTYVRTSTDNLGDFYKHWAQGQNFVTNGPILLLSTSDGQRPGATIDAPADGTGIKLHVEALCGPQIELESVELIVNGAVVHTFKASGRRRVSGDALIDVRQGSWVAARCRARDGLLTDAELEPFSSGAPEHRFRMRPSRLRFAHTSPIYVRVDGELANVPKSVAEVNKMLDQFGEFAGRTAGTQYRQDILRAVEQARDTLNKRVRRPEQR